MENKQDRLITRKVKIKIRSESIKWTSIKNDGYQTLYDDLMNGTKGIE